MTKKQEITWSGSDDNGYVGKVNGVQLYMIHTELYPPRAPFQRKAEYLFLTRRLNVGHYEGFGETSHTADEAKTLCKIDYAYGGGRAAFHKTLGRVLLIVEAFGFHVSKLKPPKHKDRISKPALDAAIGVVRAAGFRISKPKVPQPKGRPGPVFACEFSDGSHVRMSVACSTETLDWVRGERLARQAWASRHRVPLDCDSAELLKIVPSISACRFEQGDKVLAERNGGGVT